MQKKNRLDYRSYLWIIIGVSALIILTILYTIFDYQQSRADILSLLRDRGTLITDVILRTGMVALEASQDRLLEEAEQLKMIDRTVGFDLKMQQNYNTNPSPFYAIVFNSAGELKNDFLYPSTFIRSLFPAVQRYLKDFKSSGKEYEVFEIPGFSRRRHAGNEVLFLRRDKNKGYILITHRPRQMMRRMGMFNLQNLVDRFVENLPIHYIAFANDFRILAIGGQVDSSDIQNRLADREEYRISESQGKKIFEYQQALPPPRGRNTRVFVGLPATELEQLESRLLRRIILSAAIFIFLGVVSLIFMISRHKYQLLSLQYYDMKTHTSNILHNMGEGIITYNQTSQLTVINRAARQILNLHTTESVQFEKVEKKLPRIGEILKNYECIKNEEIVTEENGIRKFISLTSSVFSETEHSDKTSILLLQDITEIKQLQDQLFRQDKLNAMGKLASRVAHEIRNPLNAIGMNIQRLKREFQPQKEINEYDQLTKTVFNEVKRVNRIIESFLQFARPPRLILKKADLKNVITEINTIMLSVSQQKNINFITNAPYRIKARFDADQLKQALLNLVQNSIEACSHGDTIELILLKEGAYAELILQDTGSGIAKDNLSRIFELYYTTKENGTGLGLSLAHKIIHAHGGKLNVESPYTDKNANEIKGSRFRIILPLD